MGLFKNHSRRESGEFRWPFKPTDNSTEGPRKQHARQPTVKIGNPVLLQSTKDVRNLPGVPRTAPVQQTAWEPATVTFSDHLSFEPLFEDCYVSPVEEALPFELSAAHAAKFHAYLKDLSSTEPSLHSSEHSDQEEEEAEEDVEILEARQATTVCLASPGRPKMIDLSPPLSSFGSTHSASSSSSDVRLSGFLHSRSASEISQLETPYTPTSFFESSEEFTPAEELDHVRFCPPDDGDALCLDNTVPHPLHQADDTQSGRREP